MHGCAKADLAAVKLEVPRFHDHRMMPQSVQLRLDKVMHPSGCDFAEQHLERIRAMVVSHAGSGFVMVFWLLLAWQGNRNPPRWMIGKVRRPIPAQMAIHGRNCRAIPLASRSAMVTHLGPLKATCCEPRQAWKGATVTATSGFG